MEPDDLKALEQAGFEPREGRPGCYRRVKPKPWPFSDARTRPAFDYHYIRQSKWPSRHHPGHWWVADNYDPQWTSPYFETAAACLMFAEVQGWTE